ncbi:MAG: UPF0489 family protein [Candidatus Peribacteria bacterium]|jgi:hypothetical protein|nr:UPF0489 family protein [Candidatus Peribacteria bacterium]
MQFANPPRPLRVAPLIESASFSELEKNLTIDEEQFAFAEEGKQFHGLKYFLKFSLPRHCDSTTEETIPIYLFDNHNHALYFRYQEYLKTKKICQLIHIDQHSDMNPNQHSLSLASPKEVFQFTQRYANVGNFIQPALKSRLISEVVQIRTETALQSIFSSDKFGLLYQDTKKASPLIKYVSPCEGGYGGAEGIFVQTPTEPYILDIDLDFFAPEMGIKLEACLPKLKTLMQNAEYITIATSPYFLDQKLAIELIYQIL